jgi:hypothetical protein
MENRTVTDVVNDLLARARAANPVELKRVKVLTSYAAHSRFFAELSDDAIGVIPKQDIPSPYRYSPTHDVWDWHGTPVIIVETKHRRYEVFQVVSGRIEKDNA